MIDENEKNHLCYRCQRVYDDIKCGKTDAKNTVWNGVGNECGLAYECDLETETADAWGGEGWFVLKCSHFIPVPQSTIYADYMKSEEWKWTRAERIKKDGYKCSMCGSAKNLCVHHITYENLGDEPLDDLITLCAKCHKKIHDADLK